MRSVAISERAARNAGEEFFKKEGGQRTRRDLISNENIFLVCLRAAIDIDRTNDNDGRP